MPKVPMEAEEPAGPPPNRRRVLVLEDHPADRARMEELLHEAGYRVLAVDLGAQWWRELSAASSPALLVVALFLPDPTGAALLRGLRQLLPFAATPILAVCQPGTDAVRRLVLEAGATAFLPKPLEPRAFLDTVAHLVRKAPEAAGPAGGAGQED